MKELRRQAQEQPEQMLLPVSKDEDRYFLPCPYCKLTTCTESPVRPGARETEEGMRVIAARFAPPIYGPARVILTPCQEAAFLDLKKKLGYVSQEKAARIDKEPPAPKPILNARQTAEKILEVCSPKKGRTIDRLCELAGIDVTEIVSKVLAYLADNGKIHQVLGNRWILG